MTFPPSATQSAAAPPVLQPVTLLVTRTILPERYEQFRTWMQEGEDLGASFPGYLGSGVLAPPPGGNEFQMVYRFADDHQLAAWANSPERQDWLRRGEGLVRTSRVRRAMGLETWFGAGQRPPRWKQAITIWIGYFPVSLIFAVFLAEPLGALPLFWRVLVSTALLTPVMVFGLIPLVSKMLGNWLNPDTSIPDSSENNGIRAS